MKATHGKISAGKIWTLMLRELWESPIAFKWTPLAIAGLIVLVTILLMVLGARYDTQMAFTLDGVRLLADQPLEQRRLIMTGAFFSLSAIFSMVLVFVVVFYLAGSLHDDRKDRSILYWKSLPVSDTVVVASKLLTAGILVPAIYLAGIVITQVAMILLASIYASMADVSAWQTFWRPANLPWNWFLLASGYVIQALWLLPIYGWILFCSSWAPRLPFLIAAAVPLLISMFQHFWALLSGFRLPEFNLLMIILERLFRGVVPAGMEGEWTRVDVTNQGATFTPSPEMLVSFSSVYGHLLKPELWIGVLVGLAFLAGAVYFRRRATDG